MAKFDPAYISMITSSGRRLASFNLAMAPTWTGSHKFSNTDNRAARLAVGDVTVAPVVELQVIAASASRIHLQNNTSLFTATDGFQLALSTLDAYVWNFENGPMYFGTNNTTRMSIGAGGGITFSSNGIVHNGNLTLTAGLDAAYYNSQTITHSGANGGAMHIGSTFNGSADPVIGLIVRPFFTPSVSVGAVYGGSLAGFLNPASGKTITQATGFRAIMASSAGTGAITTVRMIAAEAFVNIGGPTPTNVIGVQIDAMSGGTNNYDLSFGTVDATGGSGAYYSRIPCLVNGLKKYLRLYDS